MTELSRRELLAAGLLAVPCLAGVGSVVGHALGGSAGTVSANPGADPDAAYDPSAHQWGFVVDTRSCIGCGLCVEACKDENGVPHKAEYNRTWVERHTQLPDGGILVESPEGGAEGFPVDPATLAPLAGPAGESTFVPRLCMQCDNPPCVSICPVSATYKSPDGIVFVDQERCIGCGYCVVSCPYGARYIVPSGGDSPTGNAGVADKCTFCYHRITKGAEPACVAVCPTRARSFGDMDDPDSTVSRLIRTQDTVVLRPQAGTRPRVRYIGLPSQEV